MNGFARTISKAFLMAIIAVAVGASMAWATADFTGSPSYGDANANVIDLLGGNDDLIFGDGADEIYMGNGDDTIWMGAGVDSIWFGADDGGLIFDFSDGSWVYRYDSTDTIQIRDDALLLQADTNDVVIKLGS